jgi:hypothetical protein
MGLLDIFGKRTVEAYSPSVLICYLGDSFEESAHLDAETYKQHLPDVSVLRLVEVKDLLEAVQRGYDIVHLFTLVGPDGTIAGSATTGTELIEKCTIWETKLLIIASENNPDGYIKDFKTNGQLINLVLTIDRRGEKFRTFVGDLLREMRGGMSMPLAWVKVAPQIPGQDHPDAPSTIFFAGLGQTRFI